MCLMADAVAEELWRYVTAATPLTEERLSCVRARMCDGKLGYGDKASAKRGARRAMAGGARALHPYLCGFCSRWHCGGSHGYGAAYYESLRQQVAASFPSR